MGLNARLAGWAILVAALAGAAYGARAAAGKPEKNVVYHWSFAAGSLFQYAVLLGLVLLLARGRLDLLALRRPASWKRAALLSLGVFLAVYALLAVLEPFLHAGREQGLTPSGWDSGRAAQFAASFLVLAGIAPFVEELTFRGLGFSLLARFGQWIAIVFVGLAFGVAHGLVEGLPLLAVFGSALAYLRSRTDSVYPGMALHALFNGIALVASVTT